MEASLPRSAQGHKRATVSILRRSLLCHESSGTKIFQVPHGDIRRYNNCLNSVKICSDILVPFGYFTLLASLALPHDPVA